MHNAVVLFARNGMGDVPAELQQGLAIQSPSLLTDKVIAL